MTDSGFERVREVYLAVSGLDPAARRAALDAMCDGDVSVRQEVESLLASEPTRGFLEPPALPDPSPAHGGQEPAVPMEMPKAIGPYKLLQVIGEGGFGVVYMAEQERPVRRRVALKLIRLGMDTKHVLARFEAERQALAMMDHPNIARVLDAGATESGRPYFVMELVRGVPITEYCDHEKLGTRARLELFIAVCRAVQHAHQKGIIHRDIKPSNILVTLHDGLPVPKVIDFGIAKATSARLTERTLFTEFRQFIGTPEYMSPEQAEMSGLDVDTRSDIYSLGVLLYELLSGGTPLDAKVLRSAGYADMQKMIRDFEPVRPSIRLSASAEATTTAARNRGVGVAELKRSLSGDLDWIALKALEKDRSRRYETAAAFAADVERFLRDEPVEARPPSIAYRARKFIRRNSGAVAVVSIVVIGLVVSASALGVLYTRERAALIRANEAEVRERSLREQAQANLDRALKSDEQARVSLERSDRVKELLKSALGAGSPNETGWSRETPASEVLLQFQKSLTEHESEDPEVMAELLDVLGDSYVQLGMNTQALVARRRAVELARPIWMPGDERMVDALLDLAWIEYETGGTDACRADVEEVLALRDPGEVAPKNLVRAYYILANTYANAVNADRAIELYQRALEIGASAPGSTPQGDAGIRDGLANALFQASRFAESLELSNQLTSEFPLHSTASFNDLRRWHRHAVRLWDLGRNKDAIDTMLRVAEVSDRVLGPQHSDTTSRWHAAAEWLVYDGRPDVARSILDRMLSVVDTEHRMVEHAKMLKVAAWSAFALENSAEADTRLREAIDVSIANTLIGFDSPGFIWRDAQVWRLTMLRSAWADDVVRRAVGLVVNDHLTSMEPGSEDAQKWIDWSELRWDLVRHGDESGPVRSGGLSELRALRDLPDGLYAMRIRAPRESSDPIDCVGWFLLADWTVREFTIEGYAPDHSDRFDAGAEHPDISRTERYLEYTWMPILRPGSITRNVGYGVIAEADILLPAGEYRASITSDDGERLSVDGEKLTEEWLGRSTSTDVESMFAEADRSQRWRVEYFQGADFAFLRLGVEPISEFARPTLSRLGITEPGASVGSP